MLPRWCARHGFLTAPKDLDDAHRAAAAGAWFAQGERDDLGCRCRRGGLFWMRCPEQCADICDIDLAGRAGQQAIVPDTMEAIGQNMDQETAYELGGGQPHHLLPVTRLDAVVLPSEGDRLGISADQTGVRDRHSVGVAAEIGQHRVRPAEGRFGIDHPVGFTEWSEPCSEGARVRQPSQIVVSIQMAIPPLNMGRLRLRTRLNKTQPPRAA